MVLVEAYVSPGGERVYVEFFPSGDVKVSAYNDEGYSVFSGVYRSRSGAMIALTRRFGKCEFIMNFTRGL